MTELAGIKTPNMDWQSTDLPSAFEDFCQYVKLIFKGPFSEKEVEMKATYFLLWLGQEGITIFNSWTDEELSEEDKKDPMKIMDRFKKHLEPKTNFRVERFQLQQFRQRENETCDDFLTSCRVQAKRCKFLDIEKDERIIEQLIWGTRYKKVQQALLKKEEMTLNQAMNEARTHEATLAQMSKFSSAQESARQESQPRASANIDAMKSTRRKGAKSGDGKCGRCGYDKHHEGQKCPAYGTVCNNCQCKNHWELVCRKPKNTSDTYKHNNSDTNKHYKRDGKSHKNTNKHVDATQYAHESAYTSDAYTSDSDEELRFEVINIDALTDSRDEIYADISVTVKQKTAKLQAKVDTGAQGNILPLRIYKQMYPENIEPKQGIPKQNVLKHTDIRITAYNKTQIHHYGIINLHCTYGDKHTNDDFYVTECDGPAIIGLKSSVSLKLVQLNCSGKVDSKITKTKEDLRKRYPDRFVPQEIPTRPWQILATDLFHLDGEDYLLVADYYSKFDVVKRIPKGKANSSMIVNMLKEICAEYGTPERLVSDNGPQYTSQLFQQFVKEWDIEHVTSSPRYPQSNGFIERMVQTVKNIIAKAKKSHQDVQKALLCQRATPIDSSLPSPAELLYGRKIRGTIPMKVRVNNTLPNCNRDIATDHLKKRQDQQKEYHHGRAHEQSPLYKEQHVRIQDLVKKKWVPGVVVNKRQEPRSYEVRTENGNILRRNRRHIKETEERHEERQYQESHEQTTQHRMHEQSQQTTPKQNTHTVQTDNKQTPTKTKQNDEQIYHTRSGRAIVKPEKLDL